MRADTLKKWLEEKGCRFEQNNENRGQGHASVTVKLKGKATTLPLIGTHQDIDKETLQRIVSDLGLQNERLPGSQDEPPHDPYKNRKGGTVNSGS